MPNSPFSISRLSKALNGSQSTTAASGPAFSPDGTKVAYVDADFGGGSGEVMIEDLASGVVTRLTAYGPAGGAATLSFSPDGSKILYAYNEPGHGIGHTGKTVIELIDVASGTITHLTPNLEGSHCFNPVFSPDGTKILLRSPDVLTAGDTNNHQDIFLEALATGTITRVSTDGSGGEANGDSINASFSADGTSILFTSFATNLIPGDTNGRSDLFLKNLATGAISCLSTTSAGAPANDSSDLGVFSPDGTHILFRSAATNLVSGDTNGKFDLFLKDLATGAVTRVSTDQNGGQLNGDTLSGFFSPDGTKIAFDSTATNVVPNDTNGTTDIFLKDLADGGITTLSVGLDGNPAGGGGFSQSGRFSADGTHYVFDSGGTNLVAGDTNGQRDVFMITFAASDLNLSGTVGADTLTGGAGNDQVDGLAGNDALYGREGDDHLNGGADNDVIYGGAGNDVIDGGTGIDFMVGGAGDDIYVVDNVQDRTLELTGAGEGVDRVYTLISYTLNAGSAIEILAAGGSDPNAPIDLTGNEFANNLWANQGNNTLYGMDGDDWLFGFGGNDYLDGGNGTDFLVGGPGDDILVVADSDKVVELPGEGFDTVYATTSWVLNAGQEIEVIAAGSSDPTAPLALTGNEFANNIWANAGDNSLYGGAGDDAIFGFAGNDLLDGGTGIDFMVGGAGDDIYVVDNVQDRTLELTGAGEGVDRVYTLISYTLNAGSAIEILAAGGSDPNAPIDLTGNEFANNLWANQGNNTLYGMDGDDWLFGFGGNDYLDGGNGTDFLVGGPGDDILVVADSDKVVELPGEGFDTVYATTSWVLNAGQEIEVIAAGSSDPTAPLALTGNEFANNIWANAGDNSLYGGAGDDAIFGFAGNDTLLGDDGDDFLVGGDGNDTLIGGNGADLLIGGDGNDTFRFDSLLTNNNIDRIADYVVADDRIVLDQAIFTNLPTGALGANAFVIGSAAADADDRIIYDSATGALFYDADGNGAGMAVQFGILAPGLAMTASEFSVS